MTTMTFGGLRPTMINKTTGRAPRSSGPLARILSAYTAWKAERELAALGDDALHDIGLDRASIAYAVRTGKRS